MQIKNVWANNEGTVAVDSQNTGDLWIHPNRDSILRHKAHEDAQIADDVQRIQSLKRGVINQNAYTLNGSGVPPTPKDIWPAENGCYFAPAASGIGGFRGIPKYTKLDGKTVALYGNIPSGNGKAPAVTKLQQGAWLPSKAKGQIEAELRDFYRWRGVIQSYSDSRAEMRRPN